MKLLLSALLSLTLSLVSAQEYNTSAPFVLKLDSTVANISGQYLNSCHAGAAIEQLCLAGTKVPSDNYGTYALNVSTSSSSEGTYETGPLVWTLQTASLNVSSGLVFTHALDSSIAVPIFEPSSSSDYVGFDADDKMFIYSGNYNESTFVAGTYPTQVTPVPLYQWYACYTYSLSYYYNALVWVTSGKPDNPTCAAVNVTRVFI